MASKGRVYGLLALPNQQILMQAVPNLPLIQPGDDLVHLIEQALHQSQMPLQTGDILVLSSKIVSKAEGRFIHLSEVTPSVQAQELAAITLKDPRLVEVILQESEAVARIAPHILIVRHRLGFTSANAGIDASNTGRADPDLLLLLPQDPDASADAIRQGLEAAFGVRLGLVISDTHGRPFRLGNLNVAIGLSGLPALIDQRGDTDLDGRILRATITPLADEIAAASGLISGQADEGQPVVLLRGIHWQPGQHQARELVRPPEQDLYR